MSMGQARTPRALEQNSAAAMSMTNITAGGNGGGLKNQSLANLSQR